MSWRILQDLDCDVFYFLAPLKLNYYFGETENELTDYNKFSCGNITVSWGIEKLGTKSLLTYIYFVSKRVFDLICKEDLLAWQKLFGDNIQ